MKKERAGLMRRLGVGIEVMGIRRVVSVFYEGSSWRRFLLVALSVVAPGFSRGDSWPVRQVLHVSVDGLAGIALRDYLDASPNEFPTFNRLKAQGAWTFNARCDDDNSYTLPNHASMLTGRPVLEKFVGAPPGWPHGLTIDFDPGMPWTLHNIAIADPSYKASVFDVAHDHGRTTAFFAAKRKFDFFLRSYDVDPEAPDLWRSDQGRSKIDWRMVIDGTDVSLVRASDSNLVSAALSILASNAPNYLFLHLADPDITGHCYLWGSERYREAVREVDRQLGRLFDAIGSDSRLAHCTAVVLTSDHGGGDAWGGHDSPQAPPVFIIPMFLWGPGIPAGWDLYQLFGNRGDPGSEKVGYEASVQPLRNGDTGNMALGLLGLPPIPGSSMIPRMRPRLALEWSADGGRVLWPMDGSRHELQVCTDLQEAVWQMVRDGFGIRGAFHEYRIPGRDGAVPKFFRLQERIGQ
ncbi:MAG: alkaline phosphatase family protein [Verrucomicrobiales bacterium]|nr:alkaline phosphatase family protein [Verrucomicrobiales bacterium]